MGIRSLKLPVVVTLTVFGLLGIFVLSEFAAGFFGHSGESNPLKGALHYSVFGAAAALPIWVVGLSIWARNTQVFLASLISGVPVVFTLSPGSPAASLGSVSILLALCFAYLLGVAAISLPFLALKSGLIGRLIGDRG